jgi:alanine racemase
VIADKASQGPKAPTRDDVQRPTQATIDLDAIAHNVAEIKKRVGSRRGVMAVVKADGYGHGAFEVSKTALRSGAGSLGVALPEEGQTLRQSGIKAPILVFGSIQPREASKAVAASLELTVCSLEVAQALDCAAAETSTRVNVHIKVDTGMGRIGVPPEEMTAFVRAIRGLKSLEVVGLFTHLASADEEDKTSSRKQIDVFNRVLRDLQLAGIQIPQRHMANSAGILELPESYYDLVRPGIAIYGLYPSHHMKRSLELKPAMTFKTKVAFIKTVPSGTPISYGGSFVTQRKTRIATLPVGYGDGYSRLLSGRGGVLLNGCRAPLIGRVCMDMCMVDVTHVRRVALGDDVILFGEDLSVDEIASQLGTINYEVLCNVGKRVPRFYVHG